MGKIERPPVRKPYEPPTLISRGALSALTAQSITPPGGVIVLVSVL